MKGSARNHKPITQDSIQSPQGESMPLLRIVIILPLLLFIPSLSYAYLDPGTGSMVLQIILGGVAGLAIFGRIFWRKLRTALFDKDRNPSEPEQ